MIAASGAARRPGKLIEHPVEGWLEAVHFDGTTVARLRPGYHRNREDTIVQLLIELRAYDESRRRAHLRLVK